MKEMQSIKAYIRKYHITISSEYTDSNPNMADPNWDTNHYKVTLHGRFDGKRRQYTTYYSMGVGLRGEPEVEDVLDCLAMDAAGIENARDFEDWASDYGYDTDSRKAERVYKNCQKAARRLSKFTDNSEAYDELLWNTERE